jgi:Arc/MetJ family transcription regulator
VSVSETYHLASRTLIVEYLRRQSAGQNLRRFVKAKNPFRPPLAGTGELKRYLEFMRSLDGLSTVISDMESDGKGVPVLLRQYLKLGGQVLAFHVDRQFGNCLDCLILVDLRQAGHATLRRFMGEAGMRRFLAAHPETPSQRAS